MAWDDFLKAEAWRNAMANLLKKGEEVGSYIEQAPSKAGQAILDAGQRQQALMNEAFDPTGKTLIRNPQAANQAAMNLLEGPLGFMPAGITAWHGSPHTFEKFDMSKVGTGEGAQSYGHGMYFAEAPMVAQDYKNKLSYGVMIGDKKIDDSMIANAKDKIEANVLQKLKNAAENSSSPFSDVMQSATKEEKDVLKQLKSTIKTGSDTGSLYKVDIPDEHIPYMLDWDKPFLQQPKNVQDAIKNSEWDAKGIVGYWMDKSKENPSYTGSDLYQRLTSTLGSDKAASEYLNSIGIKGINYLDQGSRVSSKYTGDPAFISAAKSFKESNYSLEDAFKGMKQAYKNENIQELKDALGQVYGLKPNQTSNFVVFDPTDVKILERNNQPLTRKEILEEQVKKLK